MVATRLRPTPTAEQMPEFYPVPHDHRIYGRGHTERVEETIRLGKMIVDLGGVKTIADLSCGNAYVPTMIGQYANVNRLYLGDFAPGYEFQGPIEKTIYEIPNVSLFVCGETIEHLDDPLYVLRAISGKANHLVLSTPTDNWGDTNGQHVWSWSEDDVAAMLKDVGYTLFQKSVVDSRTYGEAYRYGIWAMN